MSAYKVTYEWVWELVDVHGEILDCGYCSTYREAQALAPEGIIDYALCRRVGNDDDGEVDREYAYICEDELPEEFDGGSSVPQRFHREVAR